MWNHGDVTARTGARSGRSAARPSRSPAPGSPGSSGGLSDHSSPSDSSSLIYNWTYCRVSNPPSPRHSTITKLAFEIYKIAKRHYLEIGAFKEILYVAKKWWVGVWRLLRNLKYNPIEWHLIILKVFVFRKISAVYKSPSQLYKKWQLVKATFLFRPLLLKPWWIILSSELTKLTE